MQNLGPVAECRRVGRFCMFVYEVGGRRSDLDQLERPCHVSPHRRAWLRTFTAWTYHRTHTRRYQWTSPHGHSYLT